MAVGNLYLINLYINCLRYSRADYLRKLVRPLKIRQSQIYSPFRRWTCGRIINTYPRFINQLSTCFQQSPFWAENELVLNWCQSVLFGMLRRRPLPIICGLVSADNCISVSFYKRQNFVFCVTILQPWSPNKIVGCCVVTRPLYKLTYFTHPPFC